MGAYRTSRNCKAFTLIELLVVIAIIALLVSILMPALGKAKVLAKRAACAAQMRSIGLAAAIYRGDHDEKVPINVGGASTNKAGQRVDFPGWRFLLVRDGGAPPSTFDCPASIFQIAKIHPTMKDPRTLSDKEAIDDLYGGGHPMQNQNYGSMGVMYMLLAYIRENYPGRDGDNYLTNPGRLYANERDAVRGGTNDIAWRIQAGWQSPDRMYVADSFMTSGGVLPTHPSVEVPQSAGGPSNGTSSIHFVGAQFDGNAARRFADRHAGTNMLTHTGAVITHDTKKLYTLTTWMFSATSPAGTGYTKGWP